MLCKTVTTKKKLNVLFEIQTKQECYKIIQSSLNLSRNQKQQKTILLNAPTPIWQIRFVVILYNYQKKANFQILHQLFAKLNYYYQATTTTTTITTTTLYCICKTAKLHTYKQTNKKHSRIFVRWNKVNLKIKKLQQTIQKTKKSYKKKPLKKKKKSASMKKVLLTKHVNFLLCNGMSRVFLLFF